MISSMTFRLVELRSFNNNLSGFMLPVFSTKNSNQSFVQNLDISGNFKEFFRALRRISLKMSFSFYYIKSISFQLKMHAILA